MRSRSNIRRVFRWWACALLLCVPLCLLGCLFVGGGWGSDKGVSHPSRGGVPYFDASVFSLVDGRYVYDDGSVVADKTGVDVSDHQGDIDWDAVAADGIDFAIIRVGYRGNTEGGLYADECYLANLEQARAAGIECGVYFYSQAISVEEAEEEAAFVLDLLDGRHLEYPVTFDHEASQGGRIASIDTETASRVAQAFCTAIRAGGYASMVYGNAYDLARIDFESMADCSLWFAEYDDGPSYDRKSDIWQYTSEGSVAGISTPADLNLDLTDVPAE
ncbi:MAG: glycoside hydrolase [Atopobiaceae bacterium]|nr:glycoside hydrolase [Atopobiaceae bacterium]